MSRLIRGASPATAEYVADVELGQWLRAYRHTHADSKRIEWPDGLAYSDQLNITIELWELVEDEVAMKRKADNVK